MPYPEICAREPSFGRSCFPDLVGETSLETHHWPIELSGARSAQLAQPATVEQISHYLTEKVRQHLEYESPISAALFRLPRARSGATRGSLLQRHPGDVWSRSPNIPQPILCDWPRRTFFLGAHVAVRVEVPTFGTGPVRFETLAALRSRGVTRA